MKTITQIGEILPTLASWRQTGLRIALVPTMGNLHQGHLSLVQLAKQHADRIVANIFVNPFQFGPKEDFTSYPRTLAADTELLIAAGVDLLFLPREADIYPHGLQQQTQVVVPQLSERLCGASRPGHFTGVTTIVNKLFNIIQPHVAVFGQKDFQQLTIIQKMVADLAIPVTIISGETMREHDGLAISSRNNYLSAAERQTAPTLYQTLQQAKEQMLSDQNNLVQICSNAQHHLTQAGFKPDYFEICRTQDLLPANKDDKNLIIVAAAYLGKTRLIDNIQITR